MTSDEPPVSGRVLVADDDDAVRRVAVRFLSRAGYTVLSAADGAEALELVSSHTIDVLVSDVVMPTISGPELAREVLTRFPTVGVVLMSGYSSEAPELVELVEQGAQFVAKPFASVDLLSAVRQAQAVRAGS